MWTKLFRLHDPWLGSYCFCHENEWKRKQLRGMWIAGWHQEAITHITPTNSCSTCELVCSALRQDCVKKWRREKTPTLTYGSHWYWLVANIGVCWRYWTQCQATQLQHDVALAVCFTLRACYNQRHLEQQEQSHGNCDWQIPAWIRLAASRQRTLLNSISVLERYTYYIYEFIWMAIHGNP